MTAASASPVTDPQASSGSMAAPGIADKVRAQLLGDYPPSALSWIDGIRWTGPVQVPVSQVDRTAGDTDWKAAASDRAKLALFQHKIAGGFRKPVVLVRTPGGGKLFAIDGHTRVLACMALGVPVAAWVGTAASEHGPWEQAHARQLPNKQPAVDLSAQTAALEVTPAPYGRPDGPGLYGVKGQKHSDYFEQIVRAMMLKGKTKAEASAMAWGILRRWAAGGGKVHPEVRAAAAAALAEEAAKSGHSHANGGPAIDLAGMFTESLHPRAAGGKFGSKGGTPVAQARARNAPKGAAPAILPGGTSTRSQQLRYQASQDRQLAHQVMIRIAALVRARDAAIAGISPGKAKAPVNAAKSAAAKKAALTRKTGTAKAKAKTAVRKTTGTKKTRVQRLNGQIKLLKNDARLLLKAANHLDTEAAKS